MEYLSIALVLIFVMWLIDKNKVWRQAGKLALTVVVAALVAGSSFYGWTKYRDWRAERAALMEKEKYKAAVKECLSRIRGKTDVVDEVACEADPKVQLPHYIRTEPRQRLASELFISTCGDDRVAGLRRASSNET